MLSSKIFPDILLPQNTQNFMGSEHYGKIIAVTPSREVELWYAYSPVKTNDIVVGQETFNIKCEEGCRNFNRYGSCAPFAPDFREFTDEFGYSHALVVMLGIELHYFDKDAELYGEQFKHTQGTTIIKPRLKKVLEAIVDETENTVSTGRCDECKPCLVPKRNECHKYEAGERKYNIDAMGVDCNELVKSLFNIELQWYRDRKAPDYVVVLDAVLFKENPSPNLREKIDDTIKGHKKTSII